MQSARRILLAGDLFAFPHGTGSTSRVLALARGLQHAGAQVLVMPTGYEKKEPEFNSNGSATGVFEGIPFHYAAGTSLRPDSFARRRLARLRGVTGPAAMFGPWPQRGPDAVLLFTGHTLALPVLTRLASAARGAVLLFDGCEQPFVYEEDTPRRRVEESLYSAVGYRIYDGIFVISEYLRRYFSPLIRPGARTLLVPILVDVERFSGPVPGTDRPRYIAYTGELSASKGVHTLIRSFALVAGDFPDVALHISGRPNPPSYGEELFRLVAELGLGERIRFLGTVEYGAFPALLQQAAALVVPHPKGTFSEAAFPTKLGEYLAAGVPTIVTRVGEVDRFVRDGEDVYLVPPGDEAALAARLRAVLLDPAAAAEIGLRGRETARRAFDYRVHGARLLDFVEELRAVRSGRGLTGFPADSFLAERVPTTSGRG